jgi:hypothetical protein
VYLRESRWRNKDGTVVSYLQLAHNERHPRTGSPVAKVIHNFGGADLVDREALRRLAASISRFLEPGQAVAAAAAAGVEVLDSRRMGGAWVLDRRQGLRLHRPRRRNRRRVRPSLPIQADGFRSLQDNQRVAYTAGQGQKGPQAEEVRPL